MFKLGRKRPTEWKRRLHLSDYLKATLPAPTLPVDYSQAALPSLRNIYLNDQEGDCVIAGGGHVRGVTSGNAGALVTFTDAQINQDYSAIGGYVPGDPSTDNGCDEQTACDYWVNTGFPDGEKLAGWLAVDPTNIVEMQAAVYLFENLFFGVELPDNYVNPFPSGDGFIWDVAGPPLPQNGHAFIAYGCNDKGALIDTWAMLGTFTWQAIAKYCAAGAGGNVYVLLSPDMISKATQKAPNGMDWGQLVADFNSIGGHVPTAPPIPVPGGMTIAHAASMISSFTPGPIIQNIILLIKTLLPQLLSCFSPTPVPTPSPAAIQLAVNRLAHPNRATRRRALRAASQLEPNYAFSLANNTLTVGERIATSPTAIPDVTALMNEALSSTHFQKTFKGGLMDWLKHELQSAVANLPAIAQDVQDLITKANAPGATWLTVGLAVWEDLMKLEDK